MAWIVSDADHLGGKPRVRDTRIAVALLLEWLAAGMTIDEIVKEYPSLTEDAVRGTLKELAHSDLLASGENPSSTRTCLSPWVDALENLGHEVDSVNRLKLKGLDNGRLYRQVAIAYDLCFTKDAGFVHNVGQMREPSQVKLLHVTIPQQRVEPFITDLLTLSRARIGPVIQMGMIGRNEGSGRFSAPYVERVERGLASTRIMAFFKNDPGAKAAHRELIEADGTAPDGPVQRSMFQV